MVFWWHREKAGHHQSEVLFEQAVEISNSMIEERIAGVSDAAIYILI
jgi:hypothetical protein